MNALSNPKVEWQGRLPLDSIRVDPAIQQRAAGISQDLVNAYAEAMENGAEFPPLVVFNNGDGGLNLTAGFDLADGFHRLKARQLAHPNAIDIECQVYLGSRDAAILFACGANAQHGLPRSRADKSKAVMTLIKSEKWSGWSDREVARQCGVSHTFVAEVRREYLATLPDAGPQAQPAEAEAPSADDPSVTEAAHARPVRRRTVRRRGKRYRMATGRIGRGRSRRQDEFARIDRAFDAFQKVLEGASEPARQTFVAHRREAIMAIANTPEPPPASGPNPAEAESSPAPSARPKYGIGKLSRFTRGSAPNRSHKNAPGRHRFSSANQPRPAARVGETSANDPSHGQ